MAQVVKEGFTRLSDPTYEPAYTPQGPTVADFEIEVSILDLINSGILETGTIIESVDTDDDIVAIVYEDGEILFEDHLFESPTRAAKAAGEETRDGWDYWTISTDEGIRSLADLRAQFLAQDLSPVPL